MSYRATWLADVLRAAGCNVVEQPNWKYLRPEYNMLTQAGSPPKPAGVVCHHTASPARTTLATNLHVVTNGNGVAPGPIAQLMLWRDGTFHCIGAGKANHAGAGGPYSTWLPAGTGNDRMLGIEACNDGVGEPWAPAMLDAYEIGVAAVLRHLGHGAERAITHNEWAPTRKIDPAGPNGGRYQYVRGMTWDANAFRAAIAKRLTPPPPQPEKPPTPTEDDLMIAIYECIDAAAVFVGYAAGPNHAALQVEWCQTEERKRAFIADGSKTITVASTAFKSCTLLGPIPQGDHSKVWSKADFANVIG